MTAEARQRSLPIIDIARHVQVSIYLHGAIILQFYERTGLVDQPELSNWRYRRKLSIGKGAANNHAVFRIALLR
jgi:hypothetical protein